MLKKTEVSWKDLTEKENLFKKFLFSKKLLVLIFFAVLFLLVLILLNAYAVALSKEVTNSIPIVKDFITVFSNQLLLWFWGLPCFIFIFGIVIMTSYYVIINKVIKSHWRCPKCGYNKNFRCHPRYSFSKCFIAPGIVTAHSNTQNPPCGCGEEIINNHKQYEYIGLFGNKGLFDNPKDVNIFNYF